MVKLSTQEIINKVVRKEISEKEANELLAQKIWEENATGLEKLAATKWGSRFLWTIVICLLSFYIYVFFIK